MNWNATSKRRDGLGRMTSCATHLVKTTCMPSFSVKKEDRDYGR